jgi:hypothetical protein
MLIFTTVRSCNLGPDSVYKNMRVFAGEPTDAIKSRNTTNTYTWPQRWPRTLASLRGPPN